MAIRLKFLANPGQLKQDDAHTLRVLQQQCFEHIYIKIDDMPASYWWLVLDGKIPIGFCSLTIIEHEDEDVETAFLSLVGVIPGYRGHGLQKRMIRVREKKAKTLPKVKRIISYASYDNIWSANNLAACGYKLYKPQYEWGVPYSYYYQKLLPNH